MLHTVGKMQIEQFVMAYGVEQDRLRAILPDNFTSLRPVLRINAEIKDADISYLEFNTAVEHKGTKGWLNIGYWDNISFEKSGQTTVFKTDDLEISFTKVGLRGSCPAEKANAGCFFLPDGKLRLPDDITSNKEFCDCVFKWDLGGQGSFGKSIGKTLPATPTEPKIMYPKAEFNVHNAAVIPCGCVLGAYAVQFTR